MSVRIPLEPGMTIRYVILWFDPEGDKRRSFTDEETARAFAASEEVAPWHPMLETFTAQITSTVEQLSPDLADGMVLRATTR